MLTIFKSLQLVSDAVENLIRIAPSNKPTVSSGNARLMPRRLTVSRRSKTEQLHAADRIELSPQPIRLHQIHQAGQETDCDTDAGQ